MQEAKPLSKKGCLLSWGRASSAGGSCRSLVLASCRVLQVPGRQHP